MSSLPETPIWPTAINQIDDGQPLDGGRPDFTPGTPTGHLNMAPKQLADRTAWLKENTAARDMSNVDPADLRTALGLTGELIICGGSLGLIIQGSDILSGGTLA